MIQRNFRRKLAAIMNLARRRSKPQMTRFPEEGDVLQCVIAYNPLGGYCIPTGSMHRPAPQAVLAGRIWEQDTIEYLCAHCGTGDIVHAGTYFGDFLPAISRAVAPGSTVWAFEPNPESFRCASVTLIINRLANVELTNAGLGAVSESRAMKTSDDAGKALGGGSMLIGDDATERQEGDIDVDIVCIDDKIPADRPVSIIQLDVEGFERQALSGALATIKRCKPILILENLPDPQWLSDNILSLGYRLTGKVHDNTILIAE